MSKALILTDLEQNTGGGQYCFCGHRKRNTMFTTCHRKACMKKYRSAAINSQILEALDTAANAAGDAKGTQFTFNGKAIADEHGLTEAQIDRRVAGLMRRNLGYEAAK